MVMNTMFDAIKSVGVQLMPDEIEQHNRISQSRVGGVHKVSKVVIEFLDGSTEVVLTDEGPIYYKELFNDNNAKKLVTLLLEGT